MNYDINYVLKLIFTLQLIFKMTLTITYRLPDLPDIFYLKKPRMFHDISVAVFLIGVCIDTYVIYQGFFKKIANLSMWITTWI